MSTPRTVKKLLINSQIFTGNTPPHLTLRTNEMKNTFSTIIHINQVINNILAPMIPKQKKGIINANANIQ